MNTNWQARQLLIQGLDNVQSIEAECILKCALDPELTEAGDDSAAYLGLVVRRLLAGEPQSEGDVALIREHLGNLEVFPG